MNDDVKNVNVNIDENNADIKKDECCDKKNACSEKKENCSEKDGEKCTKKKCCYKSKLCCLTKLIGLVVAPVFVTAAVINFAPPSVSSIFLNPDKFMKIAQYKQLKLQEKAQKEAEKVIAKDISSPNGNIFGNKFDTVIGLGDVAIVEYMDYRCGYCKKAHGEIMKLLQDPKYAGKIRVIVKHYPIIGGEVSLYAAEVATAFYAKNPQKFEEFHYKMLASKLESTKDVDDVLSQFGLKFADIKNDAARQSIIDNFNFARQINISGTPAFIIGDEFVGGFVEYKDLVEKIEKNIISKESNKK